MDNPAAWHPDPAGKHDHRWWDGQRWTEHVADAGVASVDPLPAAPSPADTTDPGPTEAGPAESSTPETGPTGSDTPGPLGSEPTESSTPEAGPASTDTGRSGSTDVAAGAPRPSDGTGTPGPGPADDAAAWAQQPSQQPSQQPWGGAPASGGYQGQPPAWTDASGGGGGSNGMAIGSLVCGIVALPLTIIGGLGALLGIVAVVLGVVVLRREKRGEAGGRGMAIGGVVTGGISIVLGVVVLIFLFTFGMGVFSEMEACLEETGGDEQECQRRLERDLTERFLDG